MSTLPKALRLADALDELDRQFSRNGLCGDAAAELRRLHEALETEQEPVAHIDHRIHGWPDCFVIRADPPHTSPLYLSLPKREWVGLTDDAVFELADTNLYDGGKNYGVLAFAKAIEQALKEKNNG